MTTLVNPFLIQRGRLSVDTWSNMTVSEACRLEYMGSAEFEFGILPESLKTLAFISHRGSLAPTELRGIADRSGRPLMALGALGVGESPDLIDGGAISYAQAIQGVIDGKTRTLERTNLDLWIGDEEADLLVVPKRVKTKGMKASWDADMRDSRTTFWWDLNNHVMMSFDADFIVNRLPGYLATSWSKMDIPGLPVVGDAHITASAAASPRI